MVALLRGRAGAPCGCFGAKSRVGVGAVLRNALLAAAFAAAPSIPSGWPSRDGWLAIGLAVTFALVLALSVAVLALAREVGLLRLRLGGESALEIASEGPPLGEHVGLIHRFRPDNRTRLALAVFSSEGCALCKSLEPVVAAFRREPLVAVEVFDEIRDAEVWANLGIPGSPFAVALGRDGARTRQGDVQQLRPAREHPRDRRAPRRRGACLISAPPPRGWPRPRRAAGSSRGCPALSPLP